MSELEIQCPECGTILRFDELEAFHCSKCKRFFDEAEIRERCAL